MENKLKKLTENMHFPLYACTGVLIISVILTSLAVGMFLYTRIAEIEAEMQWITDDSLPTNVSEVSKYVLREYEGRIGIFEGDGIVPTEVLNVYVFTLPAADRNALDIGITVYGTDALCALIEDFTA